MKSIDPIEHRPVYRRIPIGSDYKPGPPMPASIPQPVYAEQQARLAEGERIWALVKQTAMGTNAPTVVPASQEPDVDTSGWDAA